MLLTEPSSRHGRQKAAPTCDYRELDCAARYETNRGNKQSEVSVSAIFVNRRYVMWRTDIKKKGCVVRNIEKIERIKEGVFFFRSQVTFN